MATQQKYRNVRTELDGLTFASKAESRRYAELRLCERVKGVGQVRGLEAQVRFELVPAVRLRGAPKLTTAIDYVADFVYEELARDGAWYRVIEDCKGALTSVYKMKRHMMKALLGLDIRETRPR